MSPVRGIGILLACAAAAATVSVGTALAAFTSAPHASGAVATATLVAPASATATATAGADGSCGSVGVSWAAVAGTASYEIEMRASSAGAWTVVDAGTGAVTSWTDTAGRIGSAVVYRVHTRTAQGVWMSSAAATTTALTCAPAAPTSVAVTNPGSSDVVSWTASANATGYTVQADVGSAGWATLATGVTATTYTDHTQYTDDESVSYRVIATESGVSSGASNTATIGAWNSFHVTAIALGSSSFRYTIQVTFSKAVTTSTVATTMYVTGDTISIGSRTAGTTDVGELTATRSIGISGEMGGTISWSAADTVMTWTSSSFGLALGPSVTLASWQAGTGALCAADASQLVSTPNPTVSGEW